MVNHQITRRKQSRKIEKKMGISKDFLVKNPESQAIKVKLDKWDHIRQRSFWTAKETLNKVEITGRVGEDICTAHIC